MTEELSSLLSSNLRFLTIMKISFKHSYKKKKDTVLTDQAPLIKLGKVHPKYTTSLFFKHTRTSF